MFIILCSLLGFSNMAEQKGDPQEDIKHLVRIANTDLDGSKALYHALTKIKGIGHMYSNFVVTAANVERTKKIGILSDVELKRIEDVIKSPLPYNPPAWMLNRRKDFETGKDIHLIGSELDFVKDNDIKMMKKIKSYKGVRHILGLPVRGQRTRSNSRKNKGKVMGVKRRPGAKTGK